MSLQKDLSKDVQQEQSRANAEQTDNQSGVHTMSPPTFNVLSSSIQHKQKEEEEEKAVQKKKTQAFQFADDDDSADNSGSGSFGGGGAGISSFTLQKKAKEEDEDHKTIQKKERNSSLGDDSSPTPPASNNNGVGNNNSFQLKTSKPTEDSKKKKNNTRFQLKSSSNKNGMPDEIRGKMENSFQADFSNVDIHKNSTKAKEIGAYAFTQGNNVHFAPGQYQPESKQGQELLGHELAHVVQQRGGKVLPTREQDGLPVNDDKLLEKEADTQGKSASEGKQVNLAPVTQNKEVSNTVQGKFVVQKQADPNANAAAPQNNANAAGNDRDGDNPTPVQTPQVGSGGGNNNSGNETSNNSNLTSSNTGATGNGEKSGTKKKVGEVGEYLRLQATSKINAAKEKIKELAENEKEKEEAVTKKTQSEKAAVPPIEEGKSKSNAEQTQSIDNKQAPTTKDETQVKSDFNTALNNSLPTKVEDVDNFKRNSKGKNVVNAVKNVVKPDVDKVVNTYDDVKTPPVPKAVPPAEPMPEIELATETTNIGLANDLIADLTPAHTDFSDYSLQSDALVEQEGITDEHLNLVDSGDLLLAKQERDGLKLGVNNAGSDINSVRSEEMTVLENNLSQEEVDARTKMRADRDQELDNARADQLIAQTDFEVKRQEVTDHINGIYETAKTTVEGKLTALETQSLAQFETGQTAAATTFENNINSRMETFKKDRYGDGWADSAGKTVSDAANRFTFGLVGEKGGAGAWIEDKLLGLDRLPEVATIFEEEKNKFVIAIDALIVTITASNTTVIEECRQIISDARIEIDEYVNALPDDLKAIGEEAQAEIQTKLDDLDTQINEKEEELKEQLETKKEEAIEAIDRKIEEMKAAMGGILDKLGNLLSEAALKFFKWALTSVGLDPNALLDVISQGRHVLLGIVKNPGNFLGNLIASVKGGFGEFQANIKDNIMGGLVNWLTGQLGDLNIQLPEQWDLKGIFNLTSQVLGVTWGFVRGKLVKYLGEDAVNAAESGFEMIQTVITEGPIALWEQFKETAGEIKTTIIEGIRNWGITEIIKKGVTYIFSLMNPASAMVQAIMGIYRLVMFFIENGSRIGQLLATVTRSIADIASGNIGGAISKIASTLTQSIPIMISFLAKILGLSGIAAAIKKIIQKVTDPIHKAIDKAVKWLVGRVRKWWKGKKGDKDDEGEDERTMAEKQKDLDDGIKEADKYVVDDKYSTDDVKEKLPAIKAKYKLKELKVVIDQETAEKEIIHVHAKVNPEKNGKTGEKEKEGDGPKPGPNPKGLRFTQSTVSNNGTGYTVSGNIKELKEKPKWDIPSAGIRIFKKEAWMDDEFQEKNGRFGKSSPKHLKNGQTYTLDNRRLYAYQKAGRAAIPAQQASPNDVERESWKFTTTNFGVSATLK